MSGKQIDVYLDELLLDGFSGYSLDRIHSEVEQAIRKKLSSHSASFSKDILHSSRSITVPLPSRLESDSIGSHIAETLHTAFRNV
jgi:hypothetical protein